MFLIYNNRKRQVNPLPLFLFHFITNDRIARHNQRTFVYRQRHEFVGQKVMILQGEVSPKIKPIPALPNQFFASFTFSSKFTVTSACSL